MSLSVKARIGSQDWDVGSVLITSFAVLATRGRKTPVALEPEWDARVAWPSPEPLAIEAGCGPDELKEALLADFEAVLEERRERLSKLPVKMGKWKQYADEAFGQAVEELKGEPLESFFDWTTVKRQKAPPGFAVLPTRLWPLAGKGFRLTTPAKGWSTYATYGALAFFYHLLATGMACGWTRTAGITVNIFATAVPRPGSYLGKTELDALAELALELAGVPAWTFILPHRAVPLVVAARLGDAAGLFKAARAELLFYAATSTKARHVFFRTAGMSAAAAFVEALRTAGGETVRTGVCGFIVRTARAAHAGDAHALKALMALVDAVKNASTARLAEAFRHARLAGIKPPQEDHAAQAVAALKAAQKA